MRRDYQVRDVAPYINWIYFFHAWGFEPRYAEVANLHDCEACRRTWQASFPSEVERNKAEEAAKLFLETRRMLRELDGRMRVQTAFRLCVANSDGNDLLLDDVRLPLLCQQASTSPDGICLCLSDFVRPLDAGVPDKVGVFAASVDDLTEVSSANDDYHLLLIQTLSDRLVEAGVELMHLEVRKSVWSYSPNEDLPVAALHAEAFQGIRPAVGYPSLPDQSINFILDRLLDFSSIGVRLTEHAAMHPHASVSGLMFAHPAARYFSIGSIGEDQLTDYAARRGMTIETIRRFLNRNC